MKYMIIGLIISIIWVGFEMWRAPMMDDNGRITKPGRKLKDLWRKQR